MKTLTPLMDAFGSIRIANVMLHNGIKCLEDLTTVSEEELRLIRGVADKTVTETKEQLAPRGLSLRPHDVWRREVIEAIYGSLDAAPLELILIEPSGGFLLREAHITSLQALLDMSAGDLRRKQYEYWRRGFRTQPLFDERHIARIRTRLEQVGLHLYGE